MSGMESRLELRQREVGPWPMNTYALVCPNTGASVLFDPGADPEVLEEMLAGSEPVAILLTHTHFDHIDALEEMRSRLKAAGHVSCRSPRGRCATSRPTGILDTGDRVR